MLAWCSMLHSLKCDMQHEYFQKKKCFDLWPHLGVKGVCRDRICGLHGALYSIPFNLICNDDFQKKKMFLPLIPTQGLRVCVRTEYVLAWCSLLHSL